MIRGIERTCRLPEGHLMPIVMMLGGTATMLITLAIPSDSEYVMPFLCTGVGSIFGGMGRAMYLDIRNQQFAERQRLLQENAATPTPPPPALAPSTKPVASPENSTPSESESQYVAVNLGPNNELQPLTNIKKVPC
jgi:hypothetical protein